jgi:hypothetical protein
MAYFEELETITLVATGVIAQYTAVSVSGTGCAATTSATDVACVGIAQNAAAAAGDAVTVAIAGITKMVAGGALATTGVRISSNATGKAAASASGNVVLGTLVGTASGVDKLASVLLRPVATMA